MAFQAPESGIQLISTLQPLMARLKQGDKALADQIARSASSIALNLGEAAMSDPGNRKARLFSAAGGANETLTALRVAVAWRHLSDAQQAPSALLLRRLSAILWKMTRR
jgi:four helix bundle protein